MNHDTYLATCSRPQLRYFFDSIGLLALTLLVYILVLTGDKVIPNIDHITHYRWLSQFYGALESGVLYPRWMYMAQSGLGEPHYSAYLFYYYLSSAVVSLGFSPWVVIKTMAVLSTWLGSQVIYFYLHDRLNRNTALLAASFWIAAPFPFFLFTNFAALPWHFSLFLALLFVLMSFLPPQRFARTKLAAVAMLLVFAHVLVGFMVFVCIGITKLWFAMRHKNTWSDFIAQWALPIFIGFSLTAFHFVPTLGLHSLLTIDENSAKIYINWRNSFIFPTFSFLLWGGRWFSMQWVYPGLALLGALASAVILWRYRRVQNEFWYLLYFVVLFTFAGLVLGSELAFPLYYFNTPFRALQWSTRFVTVGALGAALALPIALYLSYKQQEKALLFKALPILGILLTVTVTGLLQIQLVREGRDPQLNASRLNGEFHQEGNQLATIGPKWRDYVATGGLPTICKKLNANCVEISSSTQHRIWKIQSEQATSLIFPLFAFPAWHISLNGKPIDSSIDYATGLIAATVPAGTNQIDIELGDMPSSGKGRLISLFALISLLLLAGWDFRHWRNQTRS